MIHLEIISSKDPFAVGLYEYEFDRVYIGRSKKNDLIFLDKELPLNYLSIFVVKDEKGLNLAVKSFTRSPFFFVNGKKISGVLKLRRNDLIAFGENQIKIIDFGKSQIEENLAQAFSQFEQKASELKFALDFIEEVLIETEDSKNHV